MPHAVRSPALFAALEASGQQGPAGRDSYDARHRCLLRLGARRGGRNADRSDRAQSVLGFDGADGLSDQSSGQWRLQRVGPRYREADELLLGALQRFHGLCGGDVRSRKLSACREGLEKEGRTTVRKSQLTWEVRMQGLSRRRLLASTGLAVVAGVAMTAMTARAAAD